MRGYGDTSPTNTRVLTNAFITVGRRYSIRRTTIQYNTTQHNTIQYNTAQYNKTQHTQATPQHSRIQYNTAHSSHTTTQYNTTQRTHHIKPDHNTPPHHTTATQHARTHHTTPIHTSSHRNTQYTHIRICAAPDKCRTAQQIPHHSSTAKRTLLQKCARNRKAKGFPRNRKAKGFPRNRKAKGFPRHRDDLPRVCRGVEYGYHVAEVVTVIIRSKHVLEREQRGKAAVTSLNELFGGDVGSK